jgi:TonB family protein
VSTRTAYDRALSLDRGSRGVFAMLAVIAHLGVGSVLARHARAAAVEPPPVLTEVEFIAPPPPPEPAAPPKAEEPREDRVVAAAPVAHAARASSPRPASATPPPAAAGAVITAGDGSDAPVSFVTDPNGGEYGQGVVAANGVGSHTGTASSAKSAPVVEEPKPVAPVIVAKKVATPPRLVEANACRGFFPSAAEDDAATVAVAVTVQANGSVTTANVVSESPKGQGFGAAARLCVTSRKFVPASGEDGLPMPASATVNVHFSR